MRVLIIEDELPAREKLIKYIERYDRRIKIAGALESVAQTVEWLALNPVPELVFSDIELLDGNVFTVFEEIEIACPVIFATAYDQFLLQAFERSGIAYLLKPFTFEKFAAAMKKFEALRENFLAAQENFLREIQADLRQPKFKERFLVKTREGSISLLETRHIAFIQMQHEMPFAFSAAGKKYPLNDSLSALEKMLDPQQFFRLNRSEIVNLDYIEKLKPDFHDRLEISLKNLKMKLVSSVSRTPELRKWLENK